MITSTHTIAKCRFRSGRIYLRQIRKHRRLYKVFGSLCFLEVTHKIIISSCVIKSLILHDFHNLFLTINKKKKHKRSKLRVFRTINLHKGQGLRVFHQRIQLSPVIFALKTMS